VGHTPADQSFATWLEKNSGQLETLVLTGPPRNPDTIDGDCLPVRSGPIIPALAQAAAAAQAAGRPLRLHTLRVLQAAVTMHTAGQLLVGLPHLRCLQLSIRSPFLAEPSVSGGGPDALPDHLAPLQHATHLEELYLDGPGPEAHSNTCGLLPLSLKRLSWTPSRYSRECELSHLTQVTFLELCHIQGLDRTSSQLPPGLRQLEAIGQETFDLDVLEEQAQVVTAWSLWFLGGREQQLLPCLRNLRALDIDAEAFRSREARAALQQVTQLAALTLFYYSTPPEAGVAHRQPAVDTAASMHNLRSLRLWFDTLPAPPALTALTHLTQLKVSVHYPESTIQLQQQQQREEHQQKQLQRRQRRQRAWIQEVGLLSQLQWVSVPAELMEAGWAWLGGLQQLKVLVVYCQGEGYAHVSSLPWLEGCTRVALPPQLQVLSVGGMTAQQAVCWRVRPLLQQALRSSGCELVTGVDLDVVCDPAQQLAGLPQALQQMLA
jgi:hypothetical protein